MENIEKLLTADAVKFLREQNTYTEQYIQFIKSAPYEENDDIGAIIPIYCCHISEKRHGIPDNLKLEGLYLPLLGQYIPIGCNSCHLFCNPMEADSYSLESIRNMLVNSVKEEVEKQIIESYDSILPAKYYDESNVKKLFSEASSPETDSDILIRIIEEYNKDIEIDDFKVLQEAIGKQADIVSIAARHIEANNINGILAKYKRENLELERLYNSTSDPVIKVKKVLNKAKSEGKKYLSADFDFGWTVVNNIKISTDKDAYPWILSDTEFYKFTETYVQPVSMNSYWEIEYEAYMPYISIITDGEKVLYENKTQPEQVLNNQFYNLLYRYTNNGDENLKPQVYEMLENTQINFNIKIQNISVLRILLANFYTDITIVKAIVEKGAGCFINDIKILSEKYSTIVCRCENYSKDIFEILKYFKEIIVNNPEPAFNFRGQNISYHWNWRDNDTFVFQFGDGEFIDSENDNYFIHFEYHAADKEWIITIWWEDDNINIEELDKSDANEYINENEIEEVKRFTKQFLVS